MILGEKMNNTPTERKPDPQMIEMIKREWGDVLGDYATLLDHPGGLDEVLSLIRSGSLARHARR
jgi:hypothetical protein